MGESVFYVGGILLCSLQHKHSLNQLFVLYRRESIRCMRMTLITSPVIIQCELIATQFKLASLEQFRVAFCIFFLIQFITKKIYEQVTIIFKSINIWVFESLGWLNKINIIVKYYN